MMFIRRWLAERRARQNAWAHEDEHLRGWLEQSNGALTDGAHVDWREGHFRCLENADVTDVLAARVQDLGALLDDNDVGDYLEVDVLPGSGGKGYTVTIQRQGRPTAHHFRKEAEAELAELKEEVGGLRFAERSNDLAMRAIIEHVQPKGQPGGVWLEDTVAKNIEWLASRLAVAESGGLQ